MITSKCEVFGRNFYIAAEFLFCVLGWLDFDNFSVIQPWWSTYVIRLISKIVNEMIRFVNWMWCMYLHNFFDYWRGITHFGFCASNTSTIGLVRSVINVTNYKVTTSCQPQQHLVNKDLQTWFSQVHSCILITNLICFLYH